MKLSTKKTSCSPLKKGIMHRGVYYINALPLSPFQFLVFFLLEPWTPSGIEFWDPTFTSRKFTLNSKFKTVDCRVSDVDLAEVRLCAPGCYNPYISGVLGARSERGVTLPSRFAIKIV